MYKKEATEYDMDYVKKYEEDLNTTLIFVRRPSPLFSIISPVLVGRSILRCQLRLCHRRPFQPPTRSERAVRRPPPRYSPHSQPVRHPRQRSRRPACPGRPTERDGYGHVSDVCESNDLPARGTRRHAGQAMAEPIPAEFGRVDDRALRRPSTQVQRTREVAATLLCRESSRDAPGGPPSSRLRSVPTHVDDQRVGRIHPHQLHRSRSWILRRDCDRWDVIICMPIPNASIGCPSRLVEEGSGWDRLPYRPLHTGALADPPDAEPGSPAAPPPPISANDDPAQQCRGSGI